MQKTKDGIQSLKVVAMLTYALIALSACGKSESLQADGVMADVDGKILVIQDKLQEEDVCKNHYCEPNYIVRESFGWARFGSRDKAAPASLPAPAPVPVPDVPLKPTPTPAFMDGGMAIQDYSRAKMNLSEAWEVTEGAPQVIVAVVDSGIDLTHPDLKNNIWTNLNEENGSANADDDSNGYKDDVHGYDFYFGKATPSDQTGHGTHCAGIIAAIKNNFGSVGVAPNVKIMPLRFIGPDGTGTTANAIAAIQYAVANGAKIISASWGGTGYSSLLAQAVKDAQDAGVIFVAAAGNQTYNTATTPYYPGSFPGVIAVAASDSKDHLTDYSNYSSSAVMIAAPGDEIYSTYLNGSYDYLSGTSMAAPQVSGSLALALSKNQSFQPSYLQAMLCSTADPVLKDVTKCGRINTGRLLKSL